MEGGRRKEKTRERLEVEGRGKGTGKIEDKGGSS